MTQGDNLINIIFQGRKALENGDLSTSKLYAMELAKLLDLYIPSEEETGNVDGYLKEILLAQQVARWKERGRPEYHLLRDLAEERLKSQDDLIKNLDRIFG